MPAMTKRLAPLAFSAFALLAAGCGKAPEPLPRPDPADLERLLASLEAQSGTAGRPGLPDQVTEADRVSSTVARLSPEKVDPNLVATFIAR